MKKLTLLSLLVISTLVNAQSDGTFLWDQVQLNSRGGALVIVKYERPNLHVTAKIGKVIDVRNAQIELEYFPRLDHMTLNSIVGHKNKYFTILDIPLITKACLVARLYLENDKVVQKDIVSCNAELKAE